MVNVADFFLDRQVQHRALGQLGRVHKLGQEAQGAARVDRKVYDADVDALVEPVVIEVVVEPGVGQVAAVHDFFNEVDRGVVFLGVFIAGATNGNFPEFQMAVVAVRIGIGIGVRGKSCSPRSKY